MSEARSWEFGDSRWEMGDGRWEMGFSDENWVCFFVLFEAKTGASCCIRVINLIIAIGFVL